MNSDRRTTPDRQSSDRQSTDRQSSDRLAPLPGTPEAHAQGCTCPDPGDAQQSAGRALEIDENCPVHGRAAIAWDRDGERGPIDTEGDIVDSASGPELRRNR